MLDCVSYFAHGVRKKKEYGIIRDGLTDLFHHLCYAIVINTYETYPFFDEEISEYGLSEDCELYMVTQNVPVVT